MLRHVMHCAGSFREQTKRTCAFNKLCSDSTKWMDPTFIHYLGRARLFALFASLRLWYLPIRGAQAGFQVQKKGHAKLLKKNKTS